MYTVSMCVSCVQYTCIHLGYGMVWIKALEVQASTRTAQITTAYYHHSVSSCGVGCSSELKEAPRARPSLEHLQPKLSRGGVRLHTLRRLQKLMILARETKIPSRMTGQLSVNWCPSAAMKLLLDPQLPRHKNKVQILLQRAEKSGATNQCHADTTLYHGLPTQSGMGVLLKKGGPVVSSQEKSFQLLNPHGQARAHNHSQEAPPRRELGSNWERVNTCPQLR